MIIQCVFKEIRKFYLFKKVYQNARILVCFKHYCIVEFVYIFKKVNPDDTRKNEF